MSPSHTLERNWPHLHRQLFVVLLSLKVLPQLRVARCSLFSTFVWHHWLKKTTNTKLLGCKFSLILQSFLPHGTRTLIHKIVVDITFHQPEMLTNVFPIPGGMYLSWISWAALELSWKTAAWRKSCQLLSFHWKIVTRQQVPTKCSCLAIADRRTPPTSAWGTSRHKQHG